MNDLKEFEIPGHLSVGEGNGGLAKIQVDTAFSTAEIYLHGAHVTGFQKTGEAPLLFMSGSSHFTADEPIRGGVPVIFPWFGSRDGLPSHGFARTVAWNIKETALLPDGSVKLRLSMPAVEPREVEYTVIVGETLTMELSIHNSGDKESEFETCLHTYFKIGSIDSISITGLSGAGYLDQLKQEDFQETAPAIRIAEETDRVYFDTSATVEIEDPTLGREIIIQKSGSLSTVVWNPWIEKSKRMSDFGDDEYPHMVCVESGNVGRNKVTLLPGQSAILKVVLGSEALE